MQIYTDYDIYPNQTTDANFSLFSLSTRDRLRSPFIHKHGKFPTNMIPATMIMEVFMLFGGDASGPARNASITRENTTIVKEQRVHNTHELIDSETGYVTR